MSLEVVKMMFLSLCVKVPSKSEKVVVEQLFQRDSIIRQSQVTNTFPLALLSAFLQLDRLLFLYRKRKYEK